MNFKEFFNNCKFELYAIGNSNWDLYTMQYEDEKPCLVCIAKTNSGACDSFWGDFDWCSKLERKGINHGYVRVHKEEADSNIYSA